ncbi:MAG: Ig-like domain-containing protein [Rudaea sp.]
MTSSENPSTAGDSVTLVAQVIPAASNVARGLARATAAITGNVTFYDGTAVLGVVPLGGGAAAFATASLATGTHAIQAAYSGDATYAASVGSLAQVVNPAGAPPPPAAATPAPAPALSAWATLALVLLVLACAARVMRRSRPGRLARDGSSCSTRKRARG